MHACNNGCAFLHGRDTSTQKNEFRHPQRSPSWRQSRSSCSWDRDARMQWWVCNFTWKGYEHAKKWVPAPTETTIMVAELYKLQQQQRCTHAIMGVHFHVEGIRARKQMSPGTHRDHHHGCGAVQAAAATEMHACNNGCAFSHRRDTSTQKNWVPAPTEMTIMVAELFKLQWRQRCTQQIMGVHFHMEGIRARKRMSRGNHRDHHQWWQSCLNCSSAGDACKARTKVHYGHERNLRVPIGWPVYPPTPSPLSSHPIGQ